MISMNQNAKQMSIEGVLVRCGCHDPASHPGRVCPQGRAYPARTLSYWHRNPLKRLAFALRSRLWRTGVVWDKSTSA